MYRTSRNELRRDYDVLDRRTWSKAEAIVATALYAAVWDSTEHPINTIPSGTESPLPKSPPQTPASKPS